MAPVTDPQSSELWGLRLQASFGKETSVPPGAREGECCTTLRFFASCACVRLSSRRYLWRISAAAGAGLALGLSEFDHLCIDFQQTMWHATFAPSGDAAAMRGAAPMSPQQSPPWLTPTEAPVAFKSHDHSTHMQPDASPPDEPEAVIAAADEECDATLRTIVVRGLSDSPFFLSRGSLSGCSWLWPCPNGGN